jgi:hypothetical protein
MGMLHDIHVSRDVVLHCRLVVPSVVTPVWPFRRSSGMGLSPGESDARRHRVRAQLVAALF